MRVLILSLSFMSVITLNLYDNYLFIDSIPKQSNMRSQWGLFLLLFCIYTNMKWLRLTWKRLILFWTQLINLKEEFHSKFAERRRTDLALKNSPMVRKRKEIYKKKISLPGKSLKQLITVLGDHVEEGWYARWPYKHFFDYLIFNSQIVYSSNKLF